MVQRPFQGVLDDYAAQRIDDDALRSRTGWDDRWGYDYSFYGPTIDAAVAARRALLALNAAKELTKKVVHHGLESLTPDEKAQVPQLELDDEAHRAWFDALMEDMGGSAGALDDPARRAEAKDEPTPSPQHSEGDTAAEMPSADRIYTVQVIWDETMADTAAKWLAADPDGHVVILAGNGHCHDSAIVNRIKRRGITDVDLDPPGDRRRARAGRRGAREADQRLLRRTRDAARHFSGSAGRVLRVTRKRENAKGSAKVRSHAPDRASARWRSASAPRPLGEKRDRIVLPGTQVSYRTASKTSENHTSRFRVFASLRVR